jgi:hypothetical protein
VNRVATALITMAAAGCLLGAPAARAAQHTASSGQVSATVSYGHPQRYQYTDLWLTVTRDGEDAFDEPITITGCDEPYCVPGGAYAKSGGIAVHDLDGDSEPEVIADVFTGGAHCCFASEILRWTGRAYQARQHNWGDPGYRLTDTNHDGIAELLTGDDRFAYAFTDYADSRLPIRVYHYRAAALRDVTRTYGSLVHRDARKLKRLYARRRNRLFSLGVIAAWTADEYTLGHKRAALRFLAAEARAGRLRSPEFFKGGRRFIALLKKRLHHWVGATKRHRPPLLAKNTDLRASKVGDGFRLGTGGRRSAELGRKPLWAANQCRRRLASENRLRAPAPNVVARRVGHCTIDNTGCEANRGCVSGSPAASLRTLGRAL